MKKILLCVCLICLAAFAKAQSINAAEFFVDTDPGVGNGTPIAVTAGTTVSFSATVPTISLLAGFHFIAIRTRGTDDKWGLFETRGFYISTATTNAGNITAAEFFVDTDPGVGNGTAISVTAGNNVSLTTTIPTTSLSAGFHFLAIRTKDVNGKWGLFETRGFYINTATTNVGNIVAAESFIDTDPGMGNGTGIVVTPGPIVSFVASVPTTSLAQGFHVLVIRTKDASGKWGLFENRGFYINPLPINAADMVAAEYFLDADPGVGNGTPVTITQSNNINQNFILNIPGGTSNGQHFLAMRFKDADGKWGLFDFDTINVSGALPLHLLSFEAARNGSTVLLDWKTDNEVNSSHFDVERSVNGIDFIKLGTVSASNRPGINNYHFTDGQPANAVNLYRLKQTDIDGRFEYSKIIRIFFGTETNMVVYPNPVSDKLNIQLTAVSEKWMETIYDANGKMIRQEMISNAGNVLQLNVSTLAKGSYWIVLNNGLETLRAQFIKQ